MNENTHIVLSNSANGNRTLNCHGQVEFGETVGGFDQGNWPAWVSGTVPQFDRGCDVISIVAPDVCKGKGAAIINSSTTFFLCRIPGVPEEGIPDAWTTRWQHKLSPGGKLSLNCSSKDY